MTGELRGLIGVHKDSVESVKICSSLHLAASAAIDSKIHIYDLKTFSIRNTIEPTVYGGFTSIAFDFTVAHNLIAASTLGPLFVIDVRDGTIVHEKKGHAAPINAFV